MIDEHKFPPEFVKRIHSQLGVESNNFFSSLSKPPFLSIRNNPFKPSQKFNDCENVTWCSEGKYLEERPSFTTDPLFHAGTYYVQEPSSMFLSEIFRQLFNKNQILKTLDLCASPGGKSTLLTSGISPGSLLVANETIRNRIPALRENMVKWGAANVVVTNNDSKDFSSLKNYFDLILADAPCSGEGLFRKDKDAISEWSENNVNLCSARQKRILSEAWDSLKVGGILIYSTCTFSVEENENNVKFISENGNFETVKINLNPQWNIMETSISSANHDFFCYRFYPHKVKGEGFFVSCLRKTSPPTPLLKAGEGSTFSSKKKSSVSFLLGDEIKSISSWLKNPLQFKFISWKEQVYAVPGNLWEDFNLLHEQLNVVSLGICLGKIIRAELIPSHDLALSVVISDKIQSLELNPEQALQYLRKQEIKINAVQLKGWTLVKYSGFNLGWIKILSNRINNYYPMNLRILKT